MKAAVIYNYGDPEVFQIEETADPPLGPADLLIDVKASSVNPVDWKIRRGTQRGMIRYRLPWVLGLDVSGVVLKVGERVQGFAEGDEVFASPTHRRSGCYAERVAVDAGMVAHKPPELSHEEAASIPLVGLTAWACMAKRLQQGPDQEVFIQAGSGGVGTFAIQLAKHYGAWVATTCSPRNAQLVRSLGADMVIDYRSQRFEQVFAEKGLEMDLVLDALGGAERDAAFGVLKRGGRLASITSGLPGYAEKYGPNLGLMAMVGATAGFMLRGYAAGLQPASVLRSSSGAELTEIAALLSCGAIKPVIDRVFLMDEVAAAHAYMETGRARGKVVLRGWSS